jgi:hypothetical protein
VHFPANDRSDLFGIELGTSNGEEGVPAVINFAC